jgi:hypothetical protein
VPEEDKLHQRVSPARFYHHEGHEPHYPKPERQERCRRPPSPLLGLAEAEGNTDDPDGEGEKPGKVESLAGAGRGHQGRGVQQGERDGDGGKWHVD